MLDNHTNSQLVQISKKGSFSRVLSDYKIDYIKQLIAKTLNLNVTNNDIKEIVELFNDIESKIQGRIAGNIENYIFNYFVTLKAADLVALKKIINPAVVEIGVLFGGSFILRGKAIAKNNNIINIGIDPFTGYYKDQTGRTLDILLNIPVDKETVEQNLKIFFSNEELKKQLLLPYYSSDQVALDFISQHNVVCLFIDGDHSFQGIKLDWDLYASKVAPGGFIIIDNFHDKHWKEVTEFVQNEILLKNIAFKFAACIDKTIVFQKTNEVVENTPFYFWSQEVMLREAALEATQIEFSNFKAGFAKLEAVLKNQTQRFNLIDIEVKKLKQETQSLKQETQSLKQETQSLKQETQSLKQETQSLKQETQSLKQETQSLKQETQSLKQETQSLKQETQSLKQETQSLKQETQSLKQETQSLKQETQSLKQETQSLKQETQFLKQETTNLQNNFKHVNKKLVILSNEFILLKKSRSYRLGFILLHPWVLLGIRADIFSKK